jgi:hypothetical protein
MTIATDNRPSITEQRLSLDEYLTYNDGTDTRYELEQFGIKGERKKGGREAKLEYYHRYEYFRIS